MATIITSECINCGACEPECPNTAIYAGGAPWELNGASHEALAQEIFYIVPSKCSECVGFYDHEACAAVCPVDCCIPDPNNLESEAALLVRARTLHPELTIADDAPSRFRKGAGGAAAQPEGAAAPVASSAGAGPADAGAGAAAKPPSAGIPATASKPAPSPAAAPPPAPAASGVSAEFDPVTWAVPVICKDCHEPYAIPFRHFQAGVVFYCPHCSGSFVPNSTLCRMVRDTFEGFYGRRRMEREAFEQWRVRELGEFEARQVAAMEGFRERLQEMAHAMKPAGKLVRPKGIAAMFT